MHIINKSVSKKKSIGADYTASSGVAVFSVVAAGVVASGIFSCIKSTSACAAFGLPTYLKKQ